MSDTNFHISNTHLAHCQIFQTRNGTADIESVIVEMLKLPVCDILHLVFIYRKTSNKRLASNKSRPLIVTEFKARLNFLPPRRLSGVWYPHPRKTSNNRRASNKRLPPMAAGSKARLKFIATHPDAY